MTDEATALPADSYRPDAGEAIVVEVGGTQFGLDIRSVLEVSHVPPITRLPFAPKAIPGVVSLRGSILPLLDLGERLFGRPARLDGRIVIALDPLFNSEIAILVDRVVDMIPLTRAVEATPPEIDASLPEGWIAAVVSPDESRFVTMLNIAAVLERSDIEEEDDR